MLILSVFLRDNIIYSNEILQTGSWVLFIFDGFFTMNNL
jgi:hypothetical protein